MASTPSPEDLIENASDDEDNEEPAPDSSQAESSDVCPLKGTKPVFPASPKTLSQTGVPDSFISDNMPIGKSKQSSYQCLYGGCGFSGWQKDTTCTHIQRKHLGLAIECSRCPEGKFRWWSGRPFKGHMKAAYPELHSDDWWFNIGNTAVREALEAMEAAASLPASRQMAKVSPR